MKTRKQAATVINLSKLTRLMREKRGTVGYRTLGARIGVNFCTYRRIEQEGRLPDIDTFAKIAHWLGVPMESFVFLSLLDNPNP